MTMFKSLNIFSNIRKTFQIPFSGGIDNEIGRLFSIAAYDLAACGTFRKV